MKIFNHKEHKEGTKVTKGFNFLCVHCAFSVSFVVKQFQLITV